MPRAIASRNARKTLGRSSHFSSAKGAGEDFGAAGKSQISSIFF
jgi:hypothetical protein